MAQEGRIKISQNALLMSCFIMKEMQTRSHTKQSEAARHSHTGQLLLFLAMSLLEELALLTDILNFPQEVLLALDSFVFTFGKD